MADTDPLRVLIAEDETIVRLDLRGILEARGVTVCGEARDGQEAVELARSLEPDAAIFDCKMPRVDGIEAARRVNAERPMPIVMLTAYDERTLVERAVDAGVFGYLVKPFREHDVVPTLRAAVARHAELISARRAIGARPREALRINVISSSGGAWPLRVDRRDDGSLDVSSD
jgi:AmiR/NasT family two-component response regulator